ncbi:hypothetical protein DsansV1_C06g0066751 [Dioscorea sansibarensis]
MSHYSYACVTKNWFFVCTYRESSCLKHLVGEEGNEDKWVIGNETVKLSIVCCQQKHST